MVPNFNLSGKNVLITGAARGIGLAIARGLAGQGARVMVHDFDEPALGAAVEGMRADGFAAFGVLGDITLPETPGKVFEETKRVMGDPHILVNNAGVQEFVHWTQATRERLEWQWGGNVLAGWELTRMCLPAMQAAKWGRILNISSIQGKRGYANMLGYSVTKSAMDNFTRTVAREVGKDQITVNAIAPGYFDTHRNKSQFPDAEAKQKNGAWLPMERVGEPEDTVGLAATLCSEAGNYITGQIIYVDGGMDLIR